jgi:hypothetical protein
MEEMRKLYKIFVIKPERKIALETHRLWSRGEDNIKMHLEEIRWKGVDWIHLTQDRDRWRSVVNTVMNIRGP